MELAFFIYLVDTICKDPVGGGSPWMFFAVIIMVFSCVGWVLRRINLEESKNQDNAAFGRFLGRLPLGKIIICCAVFSTIYSLIPSQKTAYTMLGAYGIQTFATTVYENEQAKRIATNSLNLVEAAISKYEKELSK